MMTPRTCLLLPALIFSLLQGAGVGAGAAPQSGAVTLDRVGAGELLRRTPDGFVPLPVLATEIRLDVTGVMVRGRVLQRFSNPTREVIDTLYAFPLPDDAAVYAMEMRIGDRRIVSELQEREEARKTYEAARTEGRKAALLEQWRPNLFTTRAANINPGETIQIELEYYQQATFADGGFELRLPLTFIERYDSTSRANRPTAQKGWNPLAAPPLLPRAKVHVEIHSGVPVGEVRSPSHPIRISRTPAGVSVTGEDGSVEANRDLLLRWTPKLTSTHSGALFIEERGGERYALAMVMPPRIASRAGLGLPTETLFVVDVSGSMAGPSIRQARDALRGALDRLRPEDRFNILAFNDGQVFLSPGPLQALPDQLDRARQWIDGLEAGGGTEIYPALMSGLATIGNSAGSLSARIVFLTDGAVADEQRLLTALREGLGDTRLHTVGLGNAPNTWLMRKMAQEGRGLHTFIASVDEARNRIDDFFERLDRPVVAGLQIDWEGVDSDSIEPRSLPDLYAGQPLFISARLAAGAAPGRLVVGGYDRDGWVETDLQPREPASERPGLGLRWARARVESILDGLYEGVDEAFVRQQVLELAFRHHLVTRYTSLVAVEQQITALDASTTVRAAAALPVGGTDAPRRLRRGLGLVALAGLSWLFLRRIR